ncbi:hypothetical protein GGQ92_002885 [Gracilibacillus halotolerans]|uniref:Uncharacterized protein n=1 Tax=Gracilibacillus halotolerans TaxID=74386 RepID=A0A841RT03_9BACI|nr:hypothetical protein [Gracilibacillus halotolerans]
METIFSDFIKHETVDEDVILKYKGRLPEELIKHGKIWFWYFRK